MTITLAAEGAPLWVFIGASASIAVQTAIAVGGGKLLTLCASPKTLKMCSGVIFLIFAAHNIYVWFSSAPTPTPSSWKQL